MAIIYELSKEERLNNHIPEAVWELSRTHEVFIRDHITNKLIQVLDCKHIKLEGEVTMKSAKVTIEFIGEKAEVALGLFFAWYTDGGGAERFANECYQHDVKFPEMITDLDKGEITQQAD